MNIKILKPNAIAMRTQCPNNGDYLDVYREYDVVEVNIWEFIIWAVSMWRFAPNKYRLKHEFEQFLWLENYRQEKQSEYTGTPK